jgi:hypothetical protein
MTRVARWAGGAALLVLLLAAPAAPAAPVPPGKTALALVPEKSPLVLYLHGVERTRDRFLAFMKAALPDQAPAVERYIDDFLKNGIDGHKLVGLEKDGPIFVTFLEMPRDFTAPPKMAIVAAVKDYAKFRDGLLDDDQRKTLKKNQDGIEEAAMTDGEKIFFLDKKGWAVIAPDKETIGFFAKDYKGIDGRMSKEQQAKLLDGDLGLYLGMDRLNKEYGEQIKAARAAFDNQLFPQLEQAGALDKTTLKVYKDMVHGAFQGVEDSDGILLTVEFRPTGLMVHLQTEVRSGTPTAKTLKAFQSSPFAELERLPSGQAYYAAERPTPEMLEALAPLIFGVQGDPNDENEDKAIKAALAKIVKAGPQEGVSSAGFPPSGVSNFRFRDPAAAVEGQLDLARALKKGGSYAQVALKDKAAIKLKAEKYKDFEFHAVELPLDLAATVDRADKTGALGEEVKKKLTDFYKKNYGETLRYWVGTDGKTLVNVTAPDWKTAQKQLDAYFTGKGTVGEEVAFKEFRKELPADATLIAAVDPVRYGVFLGEAFRIGFEGAAMGAIQLPPGFPVPPEKHVPTYFGTAVTLSEKRASVDVFFSAKGINECYKAFAKPFLAF